MTTAAPVATEVLDHHPKETGSTNPPIRTGYLALLFFVASLALYFLTVSGQHVSVDGVAYYQQSKTLLFNGSFKYDPPLLWSEFERWTYTYWSEGLSLAYIPLLALFAFIIFPNDAAFRIIPENGSNLLNDATYRYINLSNSVFTALTVSLLFLVALKFGFSRKRAAIVAAVYGIASPAFGYHQEDFAQPLAALCLVAALFFIQLAFEAAAKPRRYAWLAGAGFCLGFLTLARGEALVVILPFIGLLVVWQYRKSNIRELLLTLGSFLCLMVPLLLFHFWVNIIKTGTIMGSQTSQFYSITDLKALYRGVLGSVISPGRGIVVFFPLALYTPYSLYRLFREGNRHWSLAFGAIIVTNVVFYSLWFAWYGGVSWGPRFFVPLMPIFALLAFWPRRPGRFVIGFRETWLYPALKSLAVLAGFITALAGTLLNWFALETTLPRIDKDPTVIYYHVESNLVWMRWASFFKWRDFTLYLVRHSWDGEPWRIYAALVLGLVFLGTAGLIVYRLRPKLPARMPAPEARVIKLSLFILPGLVLVYLFTRTFNLQGLPPFIDELIYGESAWQMEQSQIVSILLAGHGPLLPMSEHLMSWAFGANVFFYAGRIAAVFAGLGSLIFVYAIGKQLWGKEAGLSTVVLYIFCPFIMIYNRMGLMESLQTVFLLAALYGSIWLGQSKKSWRLTGTISVALGFLIGGSLLVKLNSIAVLAWCVVALALAGGINLDWNKGWKFIQIQWVKWLGLILAFIISYAIFAIQFFNPRYLSSDLDIYQYSWNDIIFAADKTWWPGLFNYLFPTLIGYLSLPVFILLVAGLLLIPIGLLNRSNKAFQHRALLALIPTLCGLIGLAPPAILLRVQYPRYLIMGVVPLLLVGGWLISEVVLLLKKRLFVKRLTVDNLKLVNIGLALLVSVLAIPFTIALMVNPSEAPFPLADKVQLVSGWPAGNEVDTITQVIRQETSDLTKPVQFLYIQDTINANDWKIRAYLEQAPDKNGVRFPPRLEFYNVPYEANATHYGKSVFQYTQVHRDQELVAAVQGSPAQVDTWTKANPQFQFVTAYQKADQLSYFIYKYDPYPTARPAPVNNVAGRGDLVAQLRFSTPGANQYGYTIKIKNVGPGTASHVSMTIPIDQILLVPQVDFGQSSWGLAAYSAPNAVLAFADLKPGGEINGTLIYPKALAEITAPRSLRYSVKWDDQTAIGRTASSNTITQQPGKVAEALADKVQPLTLVSQETSNRQPLTFKANYYIPDEIITYWITDKKGASTTLGKVTAGSNGEINITVAVSDLAPGKYTVAAYGNRSEVTGSYPVSVE